MENYTLSFSSKFKKDFKKYKNQTRELESIKNIIELLKNGVEAIPQTMRPHKLIGNYKGYWECHILPDLLIIWEQDEELKQIIFNRLGSHSDLFKK